jgi:hypothetical protein
LWLHEITGFWLEFRIRNFFFAPDPDPTLKFRLQVRAAQIRNDFFSDPNPNPAKSFASDRIRIHNTGFSGTIEEQMEEMGRKIQCCGSALVSNADQDPGSQTNADPDAGFT